MHAEKICDDNTLKTENPISYYLQNFKDEEVQKELSELAWTDHDLYQRILRLHFIYEMSNHEHINTCPECHSIIITDEWGEEYCSNCGIVTRSFYQYVAGQKIKLHYGCKVQP